MSAQPAGGGVYALLADGSTIEIRPAAAADFGAVLEMHRAMSLDNAYLRFFSMSPAAAGREARRICREPGLAAATSPPPRPGHPPREGRCCHGGGLPFTAGSCDPGST